MSWIISTNQAISFIPLKNEEFSHFCFFTGKKNIIFCIKKNLFNFLWGITADTSLDGSIYCVLFAWLPCLPLLCTRFFWEGFFFDTHRFLHGLLNFHQKKFSIFCFSAKLIFLLYNWVTFLFLRPKQNDFLHFPDLQKLLSCFFIVAWDGTIFWKLYSSRCKGN